MGQQIFDSPDDRDLAHGQDVLTAARAVILDHLDQQLQPGVRVLANTQQALQSHINSATDFGSAVLQQYRDELSTYLSRQLAKGLTTAQDYGIEMPDLQVLRTVQTARLLPPPESGPGVSPQPPIVPPLPGPVGPVPVCHSEIYPPDVVLYYTYLLKSYVGNYACYNAPGYSSPSWVISSPNIPEYTLVRRFPTWWACNMACRLLEDCHKTWAGLQPYLTAIDAIQLATDDSGYQAQGLCSFSLPRLLGVSG